MDIQTTLQHLTSRIIAVETPKPDTKCKQKAPVPDTQSVDDSDIGDSDLGAKVKQRMGDFHLQLTDNEDEDNIFHIPQPQGTFKGKRSGRTKTVNDIILKEVDWPYFHVYRGGPT